MGWEQDISAKLQELQSISVRYDITQELTSEEQETARGNIAIGATATQVSGENYKVTIQ